MAFSDSWADFADNIKNGAGDLAEKTFGDFIPQAQSDAAAFLESVGEDLRRWGDLLAQGDLKPLEFKSLVKGQKALAEMQALTAIGILKTRVDHFRTGLISLIVKSAFGVIGIG